ncbi:NAD(P)-dependent alcohol dehydrogenase [Haloarcula onubensis]|uniref:NAD(P)-dependent alcohol dehydrogenase n=1 Tax=Haloarcula onubensis TaxID=2950539 RepID=A0ABU2FUS9_9EURY|nr:NAD(P)-dependent alcohol dehydrogenase [Halomicroarcula sp. S3CR25-11]MDS0284520.1 NAD(P)-dependent alcohol dehydrogenase [Halomicroarcula sp. S3CR25-11]
MKAVAATEYGGPEVLRLNTVPKPTPEPDEVLIRVRASTVGPANSAMREGRPFPVRFFSGLRRPTSIPGDAFAGEITAVGRDVTHFAVGDRVFGTTAPESGTHAEYVCVPEDSTIELTPTGVSDAEAAAVADNGLTAMLFLRDVADLQLNQSILINGASGGIGTFAVQLATNVGAEVTGVCSTRNLDFVRSLGADVVVDYTRTGVAETGETYDVIFDAVGKGSFAQFVDALNPGGLYLTTVPSVGILFDMVRTRVIGNRRAVFAATGMKSADVRKKYLGELRELIDSGKIRPVIGRRYPIAEIIEAHRYVDTGHKRGTAVVTIG